jgi:hypothetical protein
MGGRYKAVFCIAGQVGEKHGEQKEPHDPAHPAGFSTQEKPIPEALPRARRSRADPLGASPRQRITML